MIMDELYTFIGKKRKRYYLWTSIAVTSTKRYFYFYHLSKYKDAGALFTFNQDLPKVNKVYTDGCFSYDKIYGDKATLEKSKMTNIIENLNSQLRDKVSYLVRRSKAHAKSFKWLDERLAIFFVNKNLE
jgi:IS1 family transposase